MKATLLSALLCFLVGNGFCQTWIELNNQLIDLYKKEKYDSALIIGQKTIARVEQDSGKMSNSYTVCLINTAMVHVSKGNNSEAEALFLEALQIRKQLFGVTHPSYVDVLDFLGSHYQEMRKFDKAEIFFRDVLQTRKQITGTNDRKYISALIDLAGLYEDMGDLNKAEPLYLEAMQLRKQMLGTNHLDYATALNLLARVYNRQGNYSKAEPLYLEALQIRKQLLGATHPHYAYLLHNLAVLYIDMDRHNEAERMLLEVLEIEKQAFGTRHPAYATSLNILAGLYMVMGNYARSEALHLEDLELRRQIHGTKHPDYANSLNSLALLYKIMGKHGKAEPLFLEALQIRKEIFGKDHPDYAQVLNNLAQLYSELGNFTKAETYLLEVLRIIKQVQGSNHPNYTTCLNNLALLYIDQQVYDKAETMLLESLQITKQLFGVNHSVYATTLSNLATLYNRLKDHKKAEALFKEAIQITKQVNGVSHPDYAISLSNLATLYTETKNYDKAEELYLEAIQIRVQSLGKQNIDYAKNLYNLAMLYLETGKEEKATSLLEEAGQIIQQHVLRSFTVLSEKEKEILIGQNIFINSSLLSLLYRSKDKLDLLHFTLDQTLLIKSLVLSSSQLFLGDLQKSRDSAILIPYDQWKTVKKLLAQQYALPLDKRSPKMKGWEEEAEKLEKDLTRFSAAFKDQQSFLEINNKELRAKLEKDEAAIEFVKFGYYNKQWSDSILYGAFVLTRSGGTVFVPLFEEKQLQKILDSAGRTSTGMVNNLYRGAGVKSKSAAAALGKELYTLLWNPLQPYLKGIKKVSYSPAGLLYSIAFHALPADSTKVLMDQYELHQYTNTRQIAGRKKDEAAGKPNSIILFGNPMFSMDSTVMAGSTKKNLQPVSVSSIPNRGSRGGTWTDLPGSEEEVKKIQRQFEANMISTTVFTKADATEEKLKAIDGKSPTVLHLATHGFFLPMTDRNATDRNSYSLSDDPLLRSGLILAGGNHAWAGKSPIEGVEDGILTAYEIAQLDLSNTALVVLSACETALGDIKGREGVFGLQRAFKMAGVKKMIVSLWQVPDKETAELMTSFYSYWVKGKTIEASFALAQAEMRKKYSPFYWAAFVLVE